MVTEELSTATERVDASFQTGGETEPLQAKEPERERAHIPGELGSHLTGIPHC